MPGKEARFGDDLGAYPGAPHTADNHEHPRPSPPLCSILPGSGALAAATHTVGKAMRERAPAWLHTLGGYPNLPPPGGGLFSLRFRAVP